MSHAMRKSYSRNVDYGFENFHCNDSPRYVTYEYPGLILNHGRKDRNGHPTIDQVMGIFVRLRLMGIRYSYDNNETMVDMSKLMMSDMSVFVAVAEFQMSRAFYKFCKSSHNQRLIIKVSLGSIGNSSIQFVTDIFHPQEEVPLARQIKKLVFVGTQTRRPIALPTWFKEKFSGKTLMKDQVFKIDKFERPLQTFLYETEILWSETDLNNHTNYSSYVKYATDALHLGLLYKSELAKADGTSVISAADFSSRQYGKYCRGDVHALKYITKDVVSHGLKNLKILYVRECLEGDLLTVYLWQEEGEFSCVKFSCEGQDGILLCQMTFEYFAPDSRL